MRRPERPAPPKYEAIASQRHNQSRAHDEQKCWIPRARDVEEALDHGGIGKARQAQTEPEDEAGDQADENLAHLQSDHGLGDDRRFIRITSSARKRSVRTSMAEFLGA